MKSAFATLLLWFIWEAVRRAFTRPDQPAEPEEFEGGPATLRPRPKFGAGAVAVAEPDDDEPRVYIPRTTEPRR